MTKYSLYLIGICLSITSCVDTAQDQLIPSGKTINVPQAKEFCINNPEDSLCSK